MGAHGDGDRRPSSNRVAFALAALLTLGAASIFIAGALHAGPVLRADACGYLSAAQVVAERHQYGHSLVQINAIMLPNPPGIDPVGWWPPGYSVAIALASCMSADDPERMVAAAHALDLIGQLLAAAGFGVLAGIVGRNRTASVLTAGLYLLSVPIILDIPRLQSEHLYMPLLAWALVLQLRAVEKPCALTVAGAAVLPAICITAGGVLQGVTNLLLPNAWQSMADLRALHDSPAVREAVLGQALLLTARDGPRPAVDLVPATIFLPEARSVYWLDNPRYSGVTLAGDDVAALARRGTFGLILRGPEERVVPE